MSQRIFDVNNEQDVKDLFDLLPDWVDYIFKKNKDQNSAKGREIDSITYLSFDNDFPFIKWGPYNDIKRPVDYSQYIGKSGWFWDNDESFLDTRKPRQAS